MASQTNRMTIRTDAETLPAVNSSPASWWPVVLAGALWAGWIIFLLAMVVVVLRTPRF